MATVDHSTLGENESAIETRRVLRRKKKELARKDVKSLNKEDIRLALKLQTCPWCDKANFKILSLHTNNIHGISAAKLREMGVLLKKTPTCSEIISKFRSEHPTNLMPKLRNTKGYKVQFSVAGKEAAILRGKLQASKPQASIIRYNASLKSADKYRKPHPCPICGKNVPYSYKKRVCCENPECRKEIRRLTAKHQWEGVRSSNLVTREKARNSMNHQEGL